MSPRSRRTGILARGRSVRKECVSVTLNTGVKDKGKGPGPADRKQNNSVKISLAGISQLWHVDASTSTRKEDTTRSSSFRSFIQVPLTVFFFL
ncbi:hypothetical protein STEG23_002009 [Scotinomys teguina]